MAEPNTLEWMTEQRDRLKQEVDVLNPKCDAAAAKLVLQERDLADAYAQIEALISRADAAEALNASAKTWAAMATEINQKLDADLATAKDLAEKRRLTLADVMQHASTLISKVMPLLNQ